MRPVAPKLDLAARLRTAREQQGLSVRELAVRVAEATGCPYDESLAGRRLRGERLLGYLAGDYVPLCRALGLDPIKALAEALEDALAELEHST